jgi:hypothetical protein
MDATRRMSASASTRVLYKRECKFLRNEISPNQPSIVTHVCSSIYLHTTHCHCLQVYGKKHYGR